MGLLNQLNFNLSEVSTSAAHSSCQFDEFEEETLMEFIDEMTSPTQLGNSNSSQMMSFPIATPTPIELHDIAIVNKETGTSKQPLSQIHHPFDQRPENTVPRPHSTLPHPIHSRNVPVQTPLLNEKWSMPTLQDRPRSCFPASASLPDVAQIQRPQSVMGHWTTDVRQEQNAVFDDSQMMKIRNNMASSNATPYKSQSLAYDTQTKQGYFMDPRSAPRHAMDHPPYQYSFNQHYRDPGTIPRPNSVMETPLQVFHTHVHHHHHVHSINNSNPGVASNNVHDNFHSADNKMGRAFFQTSPTDKTFDAANVKIEKIVNPIWPQSPMPVQDNLRKSTGMLNKNVPFHASEPSLAYSKSRQQVRMESTGLMQTLTYVNPNAPRDDMGAGCGFYNFAGLDPKAEGIVQSAIILPSQGQTYCEMPSVLLKGTCQLLPQWQRQNPTKSTGKVKKNQRGKVGKRKPKSNLGSSRFGFANSDNLVTSAKTPYGIMKQNSLTNVKKQKDNMPKSVERKRKTISDFRAPPDTPTISLSGWTSVDNKKDSAAFELSQDLFDAPSRSKNVADSSQHGTAIAPVQLPKLDEKRGEKTPQTVASTEKSGVVAMLVSEPNVRPTPQFGEEIILNSATGEWEVVAVGESQKSDDENRLCVTSLGKLPVLRDSSRGLHTQNLSKFPNLSSDEDFCNMKGRKDLKPGPAKIPYSAPEYMVSSVDLKSDSPRLKLTLKKAAPSRGKPKFSALNPSDALPNKSPQYHVTGQSEVTNSSCDFNPSETDQSQSLATPDDFNPLKFVQLKGSANMESESDYRIDDSDSTDDASEVGSVEEDSSAYLDNHMKAVSNMYVTKIERSQIPFCVTMDEFYVANALSVLAEQGCLVTDHREPQKWRKKHLGSSNDMEFVAPNQTCSSVYSNDEFMMQSLGDDCEKITIDDSLGKPFDRVLL